MNKLRFEKFEMKYGYYLPEDFKGFIYKYGGDSQFGSCRFNYPDNIINNLLRLPWEMDFHLIPFGDVGNGDYYCFYRYGPNSKDYYVGIWLHETSNFVILTSSFKSFMYKCVLDDFLSTVIVNEEISSDENAIAASESLERCEELSAEFGFDFEKIRNMKDEFDYHKLMVEYDDSSVQSLCFIGKTLLKRNDIRGFDFLQRAKNVCSFYTAPYYLMAKGLMGIGKNPKEYLLDALKTSLSLTGYSYWEEDYLEIPEDVHREISLFADSFLNEKDDILYKSLYLGSDPYTDELRCKVAKEYVKEGKYNMAMIEYNNALFCCEDKDVAREILRYALSDAKEGGLYYLTGIIEHDIKLLR
jgi:hypothetical protein